MSDDVTLDDFNEATGGKENVADEHPRFGSLPDSWKISEINSIAKVVGGSTPSTSNEEYWDGGIPWATPTDITALSENTISETEDTITQKGLESASTHLLPPKSVLMTSRATIGECAVNTTEMATNQGFKNLVPSDEIEHWYLYYRMLDTAGFLNSLGSGSTFDEISKTDVQSVDIPIPPLAEQRKIATVLHTVDQAIQKTEEIKSRIAQLKAGILQDVLTSGTQDCDLKKTKLGPKSVVFPENWQVTKLGDIATKMRNGFVGTATPFYSNKDDAIPYLQSFNVRENRVENHKQMEHVEPSFHKDNPETQLEEGDLLTVQSGHIGTSCVVPPQYDGANCHALIITRLEESKANPQFISQFLNSKIGEDLIASITVGTTVDHLNVKEFKNMQIPLPPYSEQQEIVNISCDLDRRVQNEEQYIEQLQRFKEGLMQDLLSGEVRTTDVDINIPEEVAKYG